MKRDKLWKALLWAIVTAGLYIWAKSQAAQWRGYDAVGGEVLVFGLPVLFYVLRRVARDWKAEARSVLKGAVAYGKGYASAEKPVTKSTAKTD